MEDFKSTLDVEEGQMRYLECAAIGYPPPQIKWFFAHDKINFVEMTDKAVVTSRLHDGYSSRVSSRLDYGDKNITRMDTGSYNCQVTNSEASVDNIVNVTVQCKWYLAFGKFCLPFFVKFFGFSKESPHFLA